MLVVPEWWGLNDYAKHRAEMLAQLGYNERADKRSWEAMKLFFAEIFR